MNVFQVMVGSHSETFWGLPVDHELHFEAPTPETVCVLRSVYDKKSEGEEVSQRSLS